VRSSIASNAFLLIVDIHTLLLGRFTMVREFCLPESIGLGNTKRSIADQHPPKRATNPANSQPSLKKIFDEIEEIRSRAKKLKGLSVKDSIEDGRR
jgi:hypothetical protein